MDDMINWDEWYFVESEEAESEEESEEEEEEEMKEDEEEQTKEEWEWEEEKDEDEQTKEEWEWEWEEEEEEEEEEMKEDEEKEEDLLIESTHSETKMGSSSMDGNHLGFRRFPLSPFAKKKDIQILAKDHVLPFLPAKSLVRFKAVSMEWNRWIQSPFLAHQQSYYFQELSGYFYQANEENIEFLTMNRCAYGVPTPSLSFLPESVTIKSSSNGLLLCVDQNGDNTYYICNPVNKEWKELPRPPHYYHIPETAIVLAFEPSVLNMDASYQLICPVTFVDPPMICFDVYSSKTRSWTESTTICLGSSEADSTLADSGFYIKGTAYWETSSRKVLAFNPIYGIHEVISLPNYCPHGGILTEMNEELCYIGISNIYENDYFVEVYGGLDLNLKYKMKLPLQTALNRYRLLPCLNGNILMILNGRDIHSYSLKDEKLEVIGWKAGRSEAKYLPYVNSLVSVG